MGCIALQILEQEFYPLKKVEDDCFVQQLSAVKNFSSLKLVSKKNFLSSKKTILNLRRLYELTNHLGNVLATVSDARTAVNTNGVISYLPQVISANDYYAFGATMPERRFSIEGASGYKYGFNGKMNDNDVKGEGNQQDYGMRIYDPRLGRFLSVDPLQEEYPELTPYQFASNTPIQAIDLDGLEKFYYARTLDQKGNTVLTPLRSEPIIENKQVLVGYSNPRSAMSDPQPIYKTVKEVNQRQEYIVISPIERPITRGANVTWETYEGVATYNSLEAAKNAKDADFKMQTGDFFMHSAVQGLINMGDEFKEGNIPGSKKYSGNSPSAATNNSATAANGGKKSAVTTNFIVTKDGVTVPQNQKIMREGFNKAGFPSKPAAQTSEAGIIHTVPTKNGKVDVRTMEGSSNHPKRAVITHPNSNSPKTPSGKATANKSDNHIQQN